MGKYLALLDILGFKDIINNNDHEKAVHLFKNFIVYVQKSLSKDNKIREDQRGMVFYDIRYSEINSVIISDSIIFWTNDDKTSGFFQLIDCLHSFLNFCHNTPFIFLRGGVTHGDFTFMNTGTIKGDKAESMHPVMVGKAVVDAYEIERQLQIAGCIIQPEAIHEAEKNDAGKFAVNWIEITKENKVFEDEMPFKSGKNKSWAINWVSEAGNPSKENIIKGFSSFNKDAATDDVKLKIKNSIEFYSFVKDHIYGN